MPLRRFPLRRLTALLLPFATLWLWAACASICGREAADDSTRPLSAELIQAEGVPGCDTCPFASFPEATAPERAAYDANSQTPPPAPLPIPAAGPMVDCHALARARRPPPAASPPLTLLSTLRI
jgi:hypothetical protein